MKYNHLDTATSLNSLFHTFSLILSIYLYITLIIYLTPPTSYSLRGLHSMDDLPMTSTTTIEHGVGYVWGAENDSFPGNYSSSPPPMYVGDPNRNMMCRMYILVSRVWCGSGAGLVRAHTCAVGHV